jgi:hypothetical protein
MINNNCIYSNPQIPEGYYFVKLIEVETEDLGFDFPKILAKMKILPNQGINENALFSVIIHPSQKAEYHLKNFRSTFPQWDSSNEAPRLGQIGSVKIYDAEYKGRKYSAVKFVYQSREVKRRIREIYGNRNKRNIFLHICFHTLFILSRRCFNATSASLAV